MRRIITGTIALALTLVAFGLSQPATSLAASETARARLTAHDLGLGHAQPAVPLGGASGGVLVHIGEEIPQTV